MKSLLSWYAIAWIDEAEGITQLHVAHPGPDDLTGAPEWSPTFKRFLFTPADGLDETGCYVYPLRAALLAVARLDAMQYRLLTRLRETWDPERTAWRCGVHPDQAIEAVTHALRALRREYHVRAI